MSSPVRLFVRSWGRELGGPRVLLVHGLSSYSGMWWRVASELAAAGCTVVAPDLRGHGSSPSSATYDFAAMASDLTALDQDWDLAVGHSLAGPIVARFGASTSRCRTILLLDPLMDVVDADFERIVADQLSEIDDDATGENIHRLHPEWHAEDCFHKAVGARSTSRFVVERCLRDNAPYHHLDLLDRLTMPTTIVGSDPSVGALFAPIDHIANQNVTYLMAEGSGHSIQRERPDLVVREALALLK